MPPWKTKVAGKWVVYVKVHLCFSYNLRNQQTFSDITIGFPAKWCLRKGGQNSILNLMHHYSDLVSDVSSGWNFCATVFPQIWLLMHHQYWNSELSRTSPDLVSDESPVWNFWTFSSDVILWGNQCWRRNYVGSCFLRLLQQWVKRHSTFH